MGIPLYFKQLSEKYPEIIKDVLKSKNLFLDLNCAIHPCCRKIIIEHSKSTDSNDTVESRMITEVISYIQKLINLVDPSFLYIAIDGVAPAAKMNQQRLRRYKNIHQKELENEIKKSEGINEDIYNWNTSAISPGTEFMKKLTIRINSYLKTLSLKYFFSDSEQPGEGEHKILDFIKTNDLEDSVIYGLDADLIVLAFVSKKNNIFLLRESLVFGKPVENKFLYLDIDTLKYYITKDIRDKILEKDSSLIFTEEKLNGIIDDYIFLTFLVGNDFIPHLPSFSLRNDGLSILLETYIDLYCLYETNLINCKKKKFNMNFITTFFRELSLIEDSILIKMSKKRKRFRLNGRTYKSEYDKKIDMLNQKPILEQNGEDYVNIGTTNWEYRYYSKCLRINDDEDIEQCCRNYLMGIVWTYEYYFNGCACWNYKYMYRHAPSIKNILNTLEYFNLNSTKFNKSKPVSSVVQLLSILPKKSSYLLPRSYRNLMYNSNLVHLYPDKFEIDTYYKRYYWECEPVLPNIDVKQIDKVVKKIK